jgi:uncharacterized protein involved in exopolysaccharide biosynthesis
MIRYLETFYRHRLLLLTPVVLAVLFGVAIVLAQPPSYESAAKIWFDAASVDTVGQPNATAADVETAVIKELLGTRSFTRKVGHRGGLADYLAQAPDNGSGLLSRVGRILAGPQWSTGPGSSANAVDDAVYQVLNRNVKVATDGPQIVAIAFSAPSAELAQATVKSLVDQFSDDILSVRLAQSQTIIDFFQQQVTAQAATLSAADARLADYVAKHPRPGAADPTLAGLERTSDLVRQRYDQLQAELDQARLDQTSQSAAGAGLRVIDPPTLAAGRAGFESSLLHATIAALVAGLLIMLGCLLALTAADTSLRRPDDVRSGLGLRLVGAIPRLR